MNKTNIENMKSCPKFDNCNYPICPLDKDAKLRVKLPSESTCPFCLKKKDKNQRGTITALKAHVLRVVPKSNLKMLTRANQKRFYTLNLIKPPE